jgi:xylulokinase
MAAALGLGARAGEPVVSLGTSGTAYAVMEQRAVDPSGTAATSSPMRGLRGRPETSWGPPKP